MRPAQIGDPVELFVLFDLLDGLRDGIEDERVSGLAGALGRHRNARLQVFLDPDGCRGHASLLDEEMEL